MTTQAQQPGGLMPRGWHVPHITFRGATALGLALAVLLLAVLTASQAFAPPVPSAVNLNDADAGKQVVLNAGATLGVNLIGNPTTGYQWLLEPTNEAVLKSVGEPSYTPDSMLAGAGGTYAWTFRAVGAGQTTLRLLYRRAWEQDTPPLKTFEITVVVR